MLASHGSTNKPPAHDNLVCGLDTRPPFTCPGCQAGAAAECEFIRRNGRVALHTLIAELLANGLDAQALADALRPHLREGDRR
jgi:hypothetical protein